MSAAPGALAGKLDATIAAERRRAVRLLLRHPLVGPRRPDPEGFVAVRRHATYLASWFGDQLGYRLVVSSDFARLYKSSPVEGAPARPLTTRSGQAFDPRRYELFCLVLAALERVESQTTLSQVASQTMLIAIDPGLRPLDLDRHSERRAFVHAVQAAADLGVIDLRDGDEEGFARGSTGADALYDVHPRRLAHLIACPIPPSAVEGPAQLVVDAYPDTSEGRARRARHRLMRRLVEEPVLYHDDLSIEESDYLRSQRHYLVRQLTEVCGFEVEVRAEGMACIDPEEDVTDVRFPAEGTVAHAALLVGAELVARATHRPNHYLAVDGADIIAFIRALVPRFARHWRADVTADDAGPERLAQDAVALLEAVTLVERSTAGIAARPALARFAPQEEEDHER